ncbi:hypothetical protein GCM10009799_51210 [Nocardiopsis rhodophaea]|uniref:Uncharacterized protein n=1 Tax=Nocardiopsis rhodophaea TaxID=280238 RepID=A0ABP5F4L0_9ACTN
MLTRQRRTDPAPRRPAVRRYRPYASSPRLATAPDRSRLPGPCRHAPQAHPTNPALRAWSTRSDDRRDYTANKRRVRLATAGRTRALSSVWEQLPVSVAIIGAMLLADALGITG